MEKFTPNTNDRLIRHDNGTIAYEDSYGERWEFDDEAQFRSWWVDEGQEIDDALDNFLSEGVNRDAVADQLLENCPDEARVDHINLATAIKVGVAKSEILAMPEAARWPETYVWLKSEL